MAQIIVRELEEAISQGLEQRAVQHARRQPAESVLPFDASAADHAARLAGERRRKGRPMDMRDTQIAGICEAHDAILATRSTRHVEDTSSPIVNTHHPTRRPDLYKAT